MNGMTWVKEKPESTTVQHGGCGPPFVSDGDDDGYDEDDEDDEEEDEEDEDEEEAGRARLYSYAENHAAGRRRQRWKPYSWHSKDTHQSRAALTNTQARAARTHAPRR
jgi:hypothetical protein